MTFSEIALAIVQEFIRKSGVREWEDPTTRDSLTAAALQVAASIVNSEALLMANKVLLDEFDGTPAQITFANFAGDFGPTAANDLRHASAVDTQCEWAPASLANGSYRQSSKVDLGVVRATAYKVRAAIELAATPTAGNVISLYWAPSQHATAGTGNVGGVSGADGAYTGYSSNGDDSIKQLDLIGDFVCTAQATGTVQVAEVGILIPSERYGSLVVKNSSGAAFHSDDVETHVVFDPVYSEIQ